MQTQVPVQEQVLVRELVQVQELILQVLELVLLELAQVQDQKLW